MKRNILFLCTGNSCRSQIAEGFCKYFHNNIYNSYSAGIEKKELNLNAVKVMLEDGINISDHYSKLTTELPNINFDYVITVCGHANENCPYFPSKTKIIHKGFIDPPHEVIELNLNYEEGLEIYRKVRNEIKEFILTLPEIL